MDTRNRMQEKPIQTMPMDLLGLQKRNETVLRVTDHPSSKETAMRYDTVLRIKDDSPAGDTMPTANWPEIRRRLAAAAREVDATCASLGIESTIEQQVLNAVNQAMNPIKAVNPYRVAWDASQAQFRTEERMRKWGREAAAAMSVPLAQRHKDGYQTIY